MIKRLRLSFENARMSTIVAVRIDAIRGVKIKIDFFGWAFRRRWFKQMYLFFYTQKTLRGLSLFIVFPEQWGVGRMNVKFNVINVDAYIFRRVRKLSTPMIFIFFRFIANPLYGIRNTCWPKECNNVYKNNFFKEFWHWQ